LRHEFGIEHSWENGSVIIFIIFLVITVIALIVVLRQLSKKENGSGDNYFLEILREKYIKKEISADEYGERSRYLDDEYDENGEYWFDTDNPAVMIIKERYAKCEIDSREFIEKREALRDRKKKSALDLLNERYAKGEISTEEYQHMKKVIQ
jgi:uncharacterized membrane protein